MTLSTQLKEPFIDFILKKFKRGTSNFIIIFGRRETGKTDFALLISEILQDSGLMKFFSTNIKIYKSDFLISHITNLEDLKFWCKENNGKKLFIFDEYGKAMRRRSPMSSLNVKLIDELQILRKHKLSTIAVTVDEKYVDNASLGSDVLDGFFIKPNYKNQKIALWFDLLTNENKTLKGIPPTSIKFDTWDVAPFKEFGSKRGTRFKDEQLQILWKLANGATGKEVGLHTQQVHRLKNKFIKDTLERKLSHITSN